MAEADSNAPPVPAPSRATAWVWGISLLAAFILRVLPLTAARPYISYIDEGYALHPAARMIRDGEWDPKSYNYPQLPMVVVTAAVRVLDPAYRLLKGRSLRERIPANPVLYDDLEPFPLLFLGRALCLVLGMAIVALTGVLAKRLAGPAAGAAAVAVAAFTPALVLRGSIATVDAYAAFFALACVVLTDLSRTAARPAWVCVAAGVLAGFAFASKYPAVLVFLVFGAATALLPVSLAQKLKRLGLATAGLIVGVIAGMPAVLTNPAGVLAAFRFQSSFYGDSASPTLLDQALHRAEWDLDYPAPELGVVFLLLALAGAVVGLRGRESRPAILGCCVFAAASWVLFSGPDFQPFRNLLPVVPLACVAVALTFGEIRRRLPQPRWADALLAAWLLGAFAPPLAAYTRNRLALVDTRTLAMDWVVAHAGPDDRLLVASEVAILGQELDRLGSRASSREWNAIAAEAEATKPRFVIGGLLRRLEGEPVDVAALPPIRAAYLERYCVGGTPTAPTPGRWRGNDQCLCVLERLP